MKIYLKKVTVTCHHVCPGILVATISRSLMKISFQWFVCLFQWMARNKTISPGSRIYFEVVVQKPCLHPCMTVICGQRACFNATFRIAHSLTCMWHLFAWKPWGRSVVSNTLLIDGSFYVSADCLCVCRKVRTRPLRPFSLKSTRLTLDDIAFCFNLLINSLFELLFCTSHDSCAVMGCAK